MSEYSKSVDFSFLDDSSWSYVLALGTSIAFFRSGYSISFFSIRVRVTVKNVEITPAMAIIPLSPSISLNIYPFDFDPDPSSATYSIPYKMQKLMPKTGKKSGIEAA